MQEATSQISDAPAGGAGSDARECEESGRIRKREAGAVVGAMVVHSGEDEMPRDVSTRSQALERMLFPGLDILVEEVEEEEVDLTPQNSARSAKSVEEDSHLSLDVDLVRQDEASFLHHLHEPIVVELEEPIEAPASMEVVPLESRTQSKVLRFFALMMRKPSSELMPLNHPARAPWPAAPSKQQMHPIAPESHVPTNSKVPPAPSPVPLATPFQSTQSYQKLTRPAERELSEMDTLLRSSTDSFSLKKQTSSGASFEKTKSQWERSSRKSPTPPDRVDRVDRDRPHTKPKTLRFGALFLPSATSSYSDDHQSHQPLRSGSAPNSATPPRRSGSLVAANGGASASRSQRMLHQVVIRSLDELEHVVLLGRGIQGSVYESVHKPTGFRLAVKVEQADQGVYRKGIRREFRVQCALSNRHVVKFYGSFYDRETRTVHTLLQLMEGGSLYHAANAMKGIAEPVLSQLTAHCLEGLKFMHGLGIMHRDIKTQNILLSLKEGVAKLTDFGHAKTDTMGKTFAGTIEYMSPERLNNEMYTYAADIWSLGLCVVECFMGRHPFPSRPKYWEYIESRKPGDVLFSKFEQNASEELCHFVNQCTRLTPSERPKAEFLLFHPFIRTHRNNTEALDEWMKRLSIILESKSVATSSVSHEGAPGTS
eukprot:CAMPEP_0185846584 /NCGR_PEP_ID=MMETSP1354-20130828/2162_1 /TAXON_ID=708628 /ORGANISM="Erythrolobus madagascarensis, Strain CCMP3276" /LENGTH=653 /DNA_ID=CAMNT_0028546733 /DNA_START=72 /DNA_END=2033 /DNA_ORIENTATION=+